MIRDYMEGPVMIVELNLSGFIFFEEQVQGEMNARLERRPSVLILDVSKNHRRPVPEVQEFFMELKKCMDGKLILIAKEEMAAKMSGEGFCVCSNRVQAMLRAVTFASGASPDDS